MHWTFAFILAHPIDYQSYINDKQASVIILSFARPALTIPTGKTRLLEQATPLDTQLSVISITMYQAEKGKMLTLI